MTEMMPRIAIFYGFLGGGGIERVITNLARSLTERGLKVDLVLSNTGKGSHLWLIPPNVRLIDLGSRRLFMSLPGLMRYLQREQPVSLLSAGHYCNEVALLAKCLSGVSTRIVVSEHNQLSQVTQHADGFKERLTPLIARCFYPWADGIVAVSQGVALDLASMTGLSLNRIQVIYNPVILPELLERVQEPVEHPWFAPGQPPVILGVGKLEEQKNFSNLIRAFAQVRRVQQARLVILGWGPEPGPSLLKNLVRELSLENDVDLPGHVKNPFAYMARASVFVLSSDWEGLPTVLIEAMAVGIPVVSTNCKSGPAEILDNGKYGFLTPVGDSNALAEAILNTLSSESKVAAPDWLEKFSLSAATQQYFNLLGLI